MKQLHSADHKTENNRRKDTAPPDLSRSKVRGISGSSLKLLAALAMFLDHIGAVLLEQGLLPVISSAVLAGTSTDYLPSDYSFWTKVDTMLRLAGRIAFPIFCFLLVEGFLHTRSVKRYALRLALFALLSEIPYDLATRHLLLEFSHQNVFFTLLIGLLTLSGLSFLERHFSQNADDPPAAARRTCAPAPSPDRSQKPYRKTLLFLSSLLVIVAGMLAAEFLRTDYSSFGVFLIALLYLLRGNRKRQCTCGAISVLWELTAPLAFLPVLFYNGERGRLRRKYAFYAFYPLHLLFLAALRALLL